MAWNRYSLDLELSSSQYAYCADNTALSITGDISIEAWIKPESIPSTHAIAGKWNTTGNQMSYELTIAPGLLQFLYSGDGTNINRYQYNRSIPLGVWSHLAISVDVSAKTVTFYVNGVGYSGSLVSGGDQSSIYNSSASFLIGARDGGSLPFDGLVNNVRIWSDIRTKQEIQDNMYSVLTGTLNNLVGSWFASANNYEDLAGTNDLTASGSPVFSTNVPWTGANSTDWTQAEIQADYTKVSGSANLTNFPALISGANLSDVVYAGLQSAGQDLRITTDSAGVNEVPFEIVSIDTTAKTCEIWAKIPTLSYTANTSLYIWYGNANVVAYDASAPFGSQNVWSEYKTTWHLQEASGTRYDSTANAFNLADENTVTSSTGQIGTSATFARANSEYLSLSNPTLNPATSGLTLSGWFKFSGGTEGNFIHRQDDNNNHDPVMYVTINSTGTVSFIVRGNSNTGGLVNITSSTNTFDDGNWHYFYAVFNDSADTAFLRVDGSSEATGTSFNTTNINFSSANLSVGRAAQNWISNFTRYYDGELDEIRIFFGAKTTDWGDTEYANQNAPSTFWIIPTSRRIFNIS